MNKCVYQLIDSNNEVRYVGQGSITRPYKKTNRSEDYLKILNNGGVIQILSTNLSRSEALELEDTLIRKYGTQLINKVNSPVSNDLIFEKLNLLFEICESSPSGLIWKTDRFNCSKQLKAAKGSCAGSFNKSNVSTGWSVPFNSKYVKCHRVVWVLHNKTDLVNSDLVINHINGNPLDNKILNLELCSQRINCLKKTKFTKNTTGSNGIKLELNKNRSPSYKVSISPKNGKRIGKNFAISVYGLMPAFALAFQWRENKIKELIANDNYY